METLKNILSKKQGDFLETRKTQLENLCKSVLQYVEKQDKALSGFTQNNEVLYRRESLRHYGSNIESVLAKIPNIKDLNDFNMVLGLYKQTEGMLTLDNMDIY